MSLQNFIRATMKDFQDVNAKKMTSSKQPSPKPVKLNVAKVGSAAEKSGRAEEAEKEKQLLSKKKTKREERAEAGLDNTSKRRRKEKTKKAGQEQGKVVHRCRNDMSFGEKEGKTVAETELPMTPTPDVPETVTSSPIDIEEIREPSDRAGPSEKAKAMCIGVDDISKPSLGQTTCSICFVFKTRK